MIIGTSNTQEYALPPNGVWGTPVGYLQKPFGVKIIKATPFNLEYVLDYFNSMDFIDETKYPNWM